MNNYFLQVQLLYNLGSTTNNSFFINLICKDIRFFYFNTTTCVVKKGVSIENVYFIDFSKRL